MTNTRTTFSILLALLGLVAAGCGQGGPQAPLPAEAPPEAPDQALLWVAEAASAGDFARVWDALPQSYRRDLTRLVQQYGYVVDVEPWERSFRIMDRGADLMEAKRAFILDHPLVQESDPDRRERLTAEWESMVATLRILSRSDIATARGLRTLDVRRFLASTARELSAESESFSDLLPLPDVPEKWKAPALEVEVLEQSDRGARLSVRLPDHDEAQVVELTRVDGRWVPSELASGWETWLAEMQANLDAMASGTRPSFPVEGRRMLPLLEGAIEDLMKAQSQEEFNAILEQKTGALMLEQMKGAAGASGTRG